MTARELFLVGLAALVMPLGGCIASDVDADGIQDDAVGETTQEIINGTPATDYPEAVLVDILSHGQRTMGCSGTLIAPRVVLTAAHCVADGDGWNIKAPFASAQTAYGSRSATHDWTQSNNQVSPDEHDVALVFLDSPITLAKYPTIATTALADESKVVTLGRVKGGQLSSYALYRSAPVEVRSGASYYEFNHDYAAPMIIEHGDSGGASFVPATHTVVAVNSTGDSSTMLIARVDLLADWIADQIKTNGSGRAAAPASSGRHCIFIPWQQSYSCW